MIGAATMDERICRRPSAVMSPVYLSGEATLGTLVNATPPIARTLTCRRHGGIIDERQQFVNCFRNRPFPYDVCDATSGGE